MLRLTFILQVEVLLVFTVLQSSELLLVASRECGSFFQESSLSSWQLRNHTLTSFIPTAPAGTGAKRAVSDLCRLCDG